MNDDRAILGGTNGGLQSAGKRLQLLKELSPAVSRVAVLHHRDSYWQELERVAPQLGLTLLKASVERAEDISVTFSAASRRDTLTRP